MWYGVVTADAETRPRAEGVTSFRSTSELMMRTAEPTDICAVCPSKASPNQWMSGRHIRVGVRVCGALPGPITPRDDPAVE